MEKIEFKVEGYGAMTCCPVKQNKGLSSIKIPEEWNGGEVVVILTKPSEFDALRKQ